MNGTKFAEFLPREGDEMSKATELEIKGELHLNEVTFTPEEKMV